tara:strand:+ start:11151 stop:11435 length:285 start_codon:yes stop_codon:yes gene_type:complete
MDKMHILISLSLLGIAVALSVIDNNFSSLVMYLLGLFYIYQGWTEKNSNSRSALGFLLVGIIITTVTFFAEFYVGYISQDTIAILKETIANLKE